MVEWRPLFCDPFSQLWQFLEVVTAWPCSGWRSKSLTLWLVSLLTMGKSPPISQKFGACINSPSGYAAPVLWRQFR